MASKKQAVELSAEQQAQADKTLVIDTLRATIADKKSKTLDRTRAADTLGRLAEYSWFTKPGEAQQHENVIDNNTAKKIADLTERMLGTCRTCGAKL